MDSNELGAWEVSNRSLPVDGLDGFGGPFRVTFGCGPGALGLIHPPTWTGEKVVNCRTTLFLRAVPHMDPAPV